MVIQLSNVRYKLLVETISLVIFKNAYQMYILLAAHKITYYRSRIEDSPNQVQNCFTSTKQQQQQQNTDNWR